MPRSLLLILLACALCAQSRFRPGRFQGLQLGKLKERDVVTRFGAPKNRFDDKRGTLWLYYDDIGPGAGRVEMIADAKSKTIQTITWTPVGKSLAELKDLFGPNYREAKFSFDACLGDGEASPVFEDPNGNLVWILYDELGIAILPEPPHSVEYMSEPMGTKQSRCKGRNYRLRR